jgi:hypothetical protein
MVARAPAVNTDDFRLQIFDAQGAPMIAGEIWSRPSDRQSFIDDLKDRARAARFPYALFVDLASAQIFDLASPPDAPAVFELPTRALLDEYASGIHEEKVLGPYLQRIVDSWFRNILDPLLDRPVPGGERLDALGLLSRIEGGQADIKLGSYF